MPVPGFPFGLTEINQRAGSLSVAVRDSLRQVQLFKGELDTQVDAYYTGLGMSSGDLATLRSSFVDLNDIANIYLGVASSHLTGTYDYRTFSKLLWGAA
jgi:hypothetical protein